MGVLFLPLSLFGQTLQDPPKYISPIPVEFMAGNNEFAFQTQINKAFAPSSKFSFLSIMSAASPYKNNINSFDFINTSQVSYGVFKGVSVSLGISMNAKAGFSPTVGIQYVRATPTWLIVVAPGLLLSGSHNVQAVSVIEYKPKISTAVRFYSGLQGFYNYHISNGYHQRSYINSRLGLSYQQVTFGLGGNFNWYGPKKLYKDNIGVFLRYSFL